MAALVTAPAVMAAETDAKRAAAFQAVIDCRKQADNEARLACYDSAVTSLDEAEARSDIIVIDRTQARAMRKQAFGFSLPKLAILDRGEDKAEMDSLEAKVKSAQRLSDGRWLITLDEGGTWRQVEDYNFARSPRPGSAIRIRRGLFGNFTMNVDGQSAFRVRRDN